MLGEIAHADEDLRSNNDREWLMQIGQLRKSKSPPSFAQYAKEGWGTL